jgi:ADP-ribose pyrophosphatase YjhB (NUDIX family)
MTAAVRPWPARIRVAVRGAVVHDGRLLLLRYGTDDRIHYNLPGGSVRTDEPVAMTVARKVRVSTGLEVRVGRLLFVHETLPLGTGSDPSVYHKLELVLLAHVAGAGPLAGDGDGGHPTWLPVGQLGRVRLLPPFQRRLLAGLRGSPPAEDPLHVEAGSSPAG